METPKRQHLVGLFAVAIVAFIAYFLNAWTGIFGTVVWGLILGLVLGNSRPHPANWKPGITFSEKTLLSWAIIAMGIPTGLAFRGGAPWDAVWIVLTVMTVTILFGTFAHRLFGLSKDDGILLGVGNAVCGASAIAAISGVINGNAKSTGTSIAIINLLGIVGMFALPAALSFVDFNVLQKALLTGGVLQAVGQAVAGGEALGGDVGIWATSIKLFRVAMLLPIALIFAFTAGKSSEARQPGIKLLPTFLWLFILSTAIGALVDLPEFLTGGIRTFEKSALTMAMVAIGWKIRWSELKSDGAQRLLFGTLIFILQLAVMLSLVWTFRPEIG